MNQLAKFTIPIIVGLAIWLVPAPDGLEPKAIQMLAVFVATIVAIITAPLPMAAVAIIGGTLAVLLDIIEWSDFTQSNGTDLVWLVLLAFFISDGIIKSGIGRRIALNFIRLLGRRTIGLGYGLAATELVLAPAMPSVTARAGGVMLPIARSIAEVLGSSPDAATRNRVGAYLMQTAFQCNVITSAMFITAMAGNPLAVQLAGDQGVTITWAGWAIAASVPGLICLAAIPLVVGKLNPPEISHTPDAVIVAKEGLKEMGPVTRNEWMMGAIFVALLFLWIGGDSLFGINTALAAALGVSAMLIVGIITWEDALREKAAWNTMVWIGLLIMMASKLNDYGLIDWFSGAMDNVLVGFSPAVAFVFVVMIYFYAHYFFASATAHIGALYAASLAVLIAAGVDPFMAAIALACMSNVYGCLTQYAIGSAPVLFGAGYVTQVEWLRNGFIMSVIYLTIWLTIGPLWWSVIG